MGDPGTHRFALADPAEEATRADWPVPEQFRVEPSLSMPAPADGFRAVTEAASAPSRGRIPLGLAVVLLAAALVLVAVIATVAAVSALWKPASEADGNRTNAALGGPVTSTPVSPLPVPTGDPAPGIEVPNVEGTSVVAAMRALQQAELEVETRLGESDRAGGVVLDQEPSAGERVASGSTVMLVVSSGTSRVAVPNTVGLRADRAGRLLRRKGLRVEVRLVRSSEQAGFVVAQHPSGGRTLPRGGVVQLSLAESNRAAATVRVPRLEGLELDQATARLKARGLRWSVDEVPSRRPSGIVLRQSEPSGAGVEKGTRVILEVAAGIPQHVVMDVVGLDVVLARQQLEAAGFVVLIIESPTSDPAEEGIVLDQSPGGGARRDEGDEVTLFVGMAG